MLRRNKKPNIIKRVMNFMQNKRKSNKKSYRPKYTSSRSYYSSSRFSTSSSMSSSRTL